ncbi:type II secretion system F family protein [Mycobacterium sp. MBM]|nr:type II secretion system F family protein [Mycobacterium sp. MBM]
MTAAAVLLAAALLARPAPARARLARPGRSAALPTRVLWWAAVPPALIAVAVVEPTVMMAVAVLAGTLAVRGRAAGARRRRCAEAAALRDGLDILAGELRAGAHPVAAFQAAGTEVGAEVGGRLQMVAARGRLGADVGAGLQAVSAASAQPQAWERLAVCWRLAQSHGLAIATLMKAAQHDIVERERFRARVDAGLAGARTTAAVLAGMPLLGIALGQAIGADPVAFLFSGGAGGVLLVIGIALSCLGLCWSDRIVTGLPR